ncbi:hypothetical protein CJ010_19955 [Azoarcus sp. DD4]|uniref:hypothetical protein n=1 Tax=Azoarcus sp. DD4 TaxID=2027405 RepID=UPI0011264C29|nr:hypothetical protein [Azoarcus sp. DD4]QDF98649.1 hypothetical protein CJ010_19955 [Azoarcus sp. DD4]
MHAGAERGRRPHALADVTVPVATGVTTRLAWLILALLACGALVVFAGTHPLGSLRGAVIVAICLLAVAWHRDAWLVAVPALAPVVDLAGWTGAIHLTESDALVLSALAVGGVREAFQPTSSPPSRMWRFGVLQWGLVGLLLSSFMLSTAWWPLLAVWNDPSLLAGYSTPLNGVRLAKGFIWPVLLLPLLIVAMRARQAQAVGFWTAGVLLGLLLVSLGALWERMVFTGLTDFASDYRTTSLFWEMNVGGATLDGWLALTVPFAVWMVLREQRAARLVPLMALLALVGYVAFTSFSRGLYLGVALGVALTGVLMVRSAAQRGSVRLAPGVVLAWGGFALVLGWSFVGVFQSGGYRGLAAMLGLAAGVFAVAPLVAVSSGRQLAQAALLGLIGGGLSVVAMWGIPKGVYLAYALSGASLSCLLLLRPPARWLRVAQVCALACVVWMAIAAVLMSEFWSEGRGLLAGSIAALWVLAPLGVVHRWPTVCWRPNAAAWVRVALALGSLAAVVVTFNTYYASKRFETVAEDFAGRLQHWSLAAALPQGDQAFWLGIGVGQFAERFFWQVPNGMYPGSHRIEREDTGNLYLRLGGPRHVLGFGELYRVSQRVRSDLEAPFVLALRVRAPEGEVILHTEICRKHLLYTTECTGSEQRVMAGDTWRRVQVAVGKEGLGWGGGWLPRLTVFSVASGSQGRRIEVDDLSLIDAQGRELIGNGDFSAASDFWFFSSDRHHLPWHAKNLWLHYFVEQGVLGLLAFSVLSLAAFFRVTVGRAARHALAPPLAGGMAAFFAVGAFDSLVDAPRLALLAFLMCFLALGLRAPSDAARSR